MTRRHAWPWLAALGLLAALAGTVQAQTRYSYSANGAEVTDSKTGLIWQRCSAEQSWSGSTCTGTPASYTHEAALSYAQTQTGWRLPNVKELSSITDKTRSNPAIDGTAFPNTQLDWFWSSTPYAGDVSLPWVVYPNAGDVSFAWGVYFRDGHVDRYNRYYAIQVRLVR
ncbi:MAG: DUF1566 domain-containing protein [Rhodoferax sp.]|nr:DUF1566 domain-containing protein [Rhodoferax sp.]